MSFYIEAKEILAEFQMKTPVTGLPSHEFTSYDPVLPANQADATAVALNQLTLEPGGFDEVNRVIWYTVTDVDIGEHVNFAGRVWEVVTHDNYDETTFSNLHVYKLVDIKSMQNVDNTEVGDGTDKWR